MSLAHELKRLNPEIKLVYIGLSGEKIEGLEDRLAIFDHRYSVVSGKFRRFHGDSLIKHIFDVKTLFNNLVDGAKVLYGMIQSRRLLKSITPDLVFSKGGYVVVPVGLAARSRRIPIMTHDSDAVPGLANRIVGRWAIINATGMPAEYYDYPKDRIRYTGVPIDPRIEPITPKLQAEYKAKLNLPADALVLLASGGGLGSADVNHLIRQSAPTLFDKFPKLHIFQLTGQKHQSEVEDSYGDLPAEQQRRIHVEGFVNAFFLFSGAADLVVSRAGATSIPEFAAQSKACIIIPADWIPGGQQVKNAQVLKDREAAVVVDNTISPDDFTKLVIDLLEDDNWRQKLSTNLGKLAKADAGVELANLILETVQSHDQVS